MNSRQECIGHLTGVKMFTNFFDRIFASGPEEIRSGIYIDYNETPVVDGRVPRDVTQKSFRVVAQRIATDRYIVEGRLGQLPANPNSENVEFSEKAIWCLLKPLPYEQALQTIESVFWAAWGQGWTEYVTPPFQNTSEAREKFGSKAARTNPSRPCSFVNDLKTLIPSIKREPIILTL